MKYTFSDSEHLHLLNNRPLTGTSSIGNVLAKPALIQWAANMACGYVKDNLKSIELLDEVLAEAKYAPKKKKESAAIKSTDLH